MDILCIDCAMFEEISTVLIAIPLLFRSIRHINECFNKGYPIYTDYRFMSTVSSGSWPKF